MPDLTRYQPSLPTPAASGANVALILLELFAGIVAPEVALPVLFVQFIYSLTNPQDLAAYSTIVANITTTLNNVLSIINYASQFKFLEGVDGDSHKRIADALYVEEEGEYVSLAEYLKRLSTFKPTAGVNAGETITTASVLYGIYANSYLKLSDGKYVPLTDALTAASNGGLFRYFDEITLDGANGG